MSPSPLPSRSARPGVLRLLGWVLAGVLCLGGATAMPAAAELEVFEVSPGAVQDVPGPRTSSVAAAPVVVHRRRALRGLWRDVRTRWLRPRAVALRARAGLPPPSWRGPPIVVA